MCGSEFLVRYSNSANVEFHTFLYRHVPNHRMHVEMLVPVNV